jgi:PEP-CTERM motif
VGTLIDAASPYSSGALSPTSPNPLALNSNQNLIGFRFVDPNLNGGAIAYGWMRIMLSGTSGSQPRAIVEYAYENSVGVGIAAGAIPEPSTFALLGVMAAGAVGVRAWRKRKNS